MKFLMLKFSPIIIVAIFLVTLIFYNNYRNYFKWIKDIWFYNKSIYSILHISLFTLSLALFLIATLDLRGVPEKIETSLPDQRTIIVIDSSTSMLVEDVRPNRFKKSLLMARHFIKKATGHQIAVVLFSDMQKRLVPFTDDIDLLDARIASLESLDISRGGSNIAQAIQESLQYLKTEAGKMEGAEGNILIFSDSEETVAPFDVKIPKTVNVAFVGVGTLRGGRIPLRTSDGVFRGYKTYQGKEVVSRLNEEYIKNMEKKIKSFNYWVALSYTLPTEEILEFFTKSFLKKQKYSGQVVIKPVLSHYIVVAAVIVYILSALFSQMSSFKRMIPAFFFLFLYGFGAPIWADEQQNEEIVKDMDKLKGGGLEKIERLKLAEKLLRNNEKDKALKLYEETVGSLESEGVEALVNYGVALLGNGKLVEGLKVYDHLFLRLGPDSEYRSVLRNNILVALRKNKDVSKSNEKKEKKSDGQKKNEQQNESGKSKDKKESQKKKEQNPDKQKQQNEDKEQKKQDKEQALKKSFDEKEDRIKKKRKLTKIPAVLKQIMNEDRDLQKKYIDTRTKGKKRAPKDW